MPTSYSPLRYPGGKTKLYNYVRTILESNNLLGETYIEPFAGGAGLALKLLINKDVKRIVINDLDPAIYSFWYSILNYTDEFCHMIGGIPITTAEWERQKEIYSNLNELHRLSLGFATFFLNRTNLAGIIKGGIIGGHGQTGKYKIDARFNRQSLINKVKTIASLRSKIVLLNLDAKVLLSSGYLRKYYKSFINLDPPYVKKGSQLYKNSFVESDHRELSKLVKKCTRKWIVTYDICPLTAELYKNYACSYFDLTYSVQGSKKAQEYIFFSDNVILPDSIIVEQKKKRQSNCH